MKTIATNALKKAILFGTGAVLISSLSLMAKINPTSETETHPMSGSETRNGTNQQLYAFLTFQKSDAEEAMNFYVDLFENSSIIELTRWGKDGPGAEGTIMHATFELNGMKFMCSDSPPVHNWDFTPAVSIYVNCKNEEELNTLYSNLSENGMVAMPLGDYGFSRKFGWVIDRFGVSWQLNLPE